MTLDVARIRRVDCHVHYQPRGFEQPRHAGPAGGMLGNPEAAHRPGWTDLGELRQAMDDTRVDLGVILAFPHHATPFRHSDESIPDVIGRYNRAMSEDLATADGDRFVATATIDPLSGPEGVAGA